jgi:hypothetical protein
VAQLHIPDDLKRALERVAEGTEQRWEEIAWTALLAHVLANPRAEIERPEWRVRGGEA